ncbi:MAG: hypothetical protein AB4426_30900 [Xenococcaceae cyanobacterium]
MTSIFEAKKHFQDHYRFEEGFVGVGIGRLANRETLRVYVADSQFPLAQRFAREGSFEGFPVQVEVSGKIKAF